MPHCWHEGHSASGTQRMPGSFVRFFIDLTQMREKEKEKRDEKRPETLSSAVALAVGRLDLFLGKHATQHTEIRGWVAQHDHALRKRTFGVLSEAAERAARCHAEAPVMRFQTPRSPPPFCGPLSPALLFSRFGAKLLALGSCVVTHNFSSSISFLQFATSNM